MCNNVIYQLYHIVFICSKNNSIAEFEEIKQVNFVQKNNLRNPDGSLLLPLDVPDFNFRSALSLEKNLNDSNSFSYLYFNLASSQLLKISDEQSSNHS